MIRTADLTGALLDYYVARAEGIPAEQLEIRQVQRSSETHLVRKHPTFRTGADTALPYSIDWNLGGPLIARYAVAFEGQPGGAEGNGQWLAYFSEGPDAWSANGDDHMTAACRAVVRAVVRAAFGDEVEEVAVCE